MLMFIIADIALGIWAAYGQGIWAYCWKIPILFLATSAICTTVVQAVQTKRSVWPRILWIGNIIGVGLAYFVMAPKWHILGVWFALACVQALAGAEKHANIPPSKTLQLLFLGGSTEDNTHLAGKRPLNSPYLSLDVHFNSICGEACAEMLHSVEEEPLPYDIIYQNLMIWGIVHFEKDYTQGVFSDALEFMDKQLTKKIGGIYFGYGLYLFQESKVFKDLAGTYDFSENKLWQRASKHVDILEEVQARIETSKRSEGLTLRGLTASQVEILEEYTKWDFQIEASGMADIIVTETGFAENFPEVLGMIADAMEEQVR